MKTVETKQPDLGLIKKISQSIGELPPSPTVVSRVMGLTSDLNSNVEELGEVLAADAALTAKVLRLSNSSFYGRSRTVSSLREAILILGFYTLRSLVIASTTYSLYRSKGNPDDGRKLWEHSLASALAARIVADKIAHPDLEEIFIAGLLHDIGKLILRERLGEVFQEVGSAAHNNNMSYLEVEQSKLGFTHADLGAAVLERWCLPGKLVDGVRYHHLSQFDPETSNNVPIHAVVNFGNELAKLIGACYANLQQVRLDNLPLATRYHFDQETIENIALDLEDHFAEEKRLFEEA